MAKYSKKKIREICSLIKKDSYTIAEICSLTDISEETFYCWKRTKPEFSESIEKAKEKFNELLVAEAKRSLLKMVQGYTVQEKKTVTTDSGKKTDEGKPIVKVKEHTVVDKHYQPNPTMIIFTLTNRDSENWKNRQSTELTGKDGKDFEPSVIILPSNNRENSENLQESSSNNE